MVIIRFSDDATERRALGILAKHFSCQGWTTGETMVPEPALHALAAAGITFSVITCQSTETAIPRCHQGQQYHPCPGCGTPTELGTVCDLCSIG